MAGSFGTSKNFGLFAPASRNLEALNSRVQALRPVLQPASEIDSRISAKLAKISEREGEDAVLTGGTRSLHRRLLALNVYENAASPQVHQPRTGASLRSLSA